MIVSMRRIKEIEGEKRNDRNINKPKSQFFEKIQTSNKINSRMEGTKQRISELTEKQKLPNLNNGRTQTEKKNDRVSKTCKNKIKDVTFVSMAFQKDKRESIGLKKYQKK